MLRSKAKEICLGIVVRWRKESMPRGVSGGINGYRVVGTATGRLRGFPANVLMFDGHVLPRMRTAEAEIYDAIAGRAAQETPHPSPDFIAGAQYYEDVMRIARLTGATIVASQQPVLREDGIPL